MEQILNQIKKLQTIEPRPGFISWSKKAILSSPQETGRQPFFAAWPLPRLALSGSMILATISLVTLSAGLISQKPTVADLYDLNQEMASATEKIDITIKQINYFDQNAQVASLALDEAATNDLHHLDSGVLEKELENFDSIDGYLRGENIDNLLNQASQ
jgi:hypothetical protein